MKYRLFAPLALLLVLTCASIAFFIYFGQDFPPTMAVRFDIGGHPTQWMDRVKFIVLASFLSFMLPTFIASLGMLPRVLPISIISLPNKAYWFAPERAEASMNKLMWCQLWLGCLIQAFLIALNVGLARANAATPPVLGTGALSAPVLLLFAGLVAWGLAVRRAFSVPASC